jgi:hypothetical protein
MTTNDNKTDGNRRSSRLQDSLSKGVESAGGGQDDRVIVKNHKGNLFAFFDMFLRLILKKLKMMYCYI